MKKSCSIALFYEFHNDAAPTNAITKLLPQLQNKGFKSFCAEEPKDTTRKQKITEHAKMIRTLNKVFQAKTLAGPEVQRILKYHNFPKDYETNAALKEIKEAYTPQLEASKSYVKLLTDMDKHGISYCGMDMTEKDRALLDDKYIVNDKLIQSQRIRDKHMTEQLDKACIKGDVVALTGLDHHKLAVDLRNKGHQVQEYFIINLPPTTDISIAWSDYALRGCDTKMCSDYVNTNMKTIQVIDLFAHPELDSAKIVGDSLESFGNNPEDL